VVWQLKGPPVRAVGTRLADRNKGYKTDVGRLFIACLIALSWVAPGDDSTYGRAAQYDLRYAADSLMLVEQWEECPRVAGMPQPDSAGTVQLFDVPIPPGTWYIGLKTADEVPNWSGLSNIIRREVTSSSVEEDHPPVKPKKRHTGLGCR
jgi:hypothetical protein